MNAGRGLARSSSLHRRHTVSKKYEFSRRARLFSVAAFLVSVSAGIFLRLWVLQIKEHERWMERAERQQGKQVVVQAARGDILDRQGRTLATSRPAFAVALHPQKVANPEALTLQLAKLTGRSKSYVRRKMNAPQRFVWLEHRVPWAVRDELAQIKDPSVVVMRDFIRLYPQGNLAGSILGRVSRDGAGQAGVEASFNSRLAAKDDKLSGNRDARGRANAAYTPVSASGIFTDTVRPEGSDIMLTIDAVIQSIVEREVRTGLQDSNAKTVSALVLDSDSGEILAMAQSDSFNPTAPSITSASSLRNRVIQDSFEPGSTMKAIVGAIAIEHGIVRGTDMMNCENGSYRFGGRTIHDVHPVGRVPFREAIIRSSNICMAKVAERLGKERLWRELSQFGFGKRTGIELPGETGGILRNASNWADIDLATHAFGHGVSANALQIASAFSAIVNGGIYFEPTITKRDSKPKQHRVLRKETSDAMKGILRDVIEGEHGTARRAAIPGVLVMGKTGTAQKVRTDGRGYDHNRVTASFVGAAEVKYGSEARRLTMIVVVDEPNVMPRWGGTVAAPVFRRSMQDIVQYLFPQSKSVVAVTLEDAEKSDGGTLAL
ncbi:MAG: penicillin-binding protein 2 [Bdellovibrionales bacterium]|nr:penicillin-binding protein 2 [Bdellovibrionales bacterium]